MRPITKVTLSNGLELKTTGNHPYRVGDDWIAADKLWLGACVVIYNEPEKWKPIVGWSGYEVSSWGRVRSSKVWRGQIGRMLTPFGKGSWGHLQVGLFDYKGGRQFSEVHRLVAATFLCKSYKSETRHLNGIAWDNTLENLAQGTRLENAKDSQRHGTSTMNAAVTNEAVKYIRAYPYKWGVDSALGRELGISRRSVKDIRIGKFHVHPTVGKITVLRSASSGKN